MSIPMMIPLSQCLSPWPLAGERDVNAQCTQSVRRRMPGHAVGGRIPGVSWCGLDEHLVSSSVLSSHSLELLLNIKFIFCDH